MKVLFVTRSISDGGAAVAVSRYLDALSSADELDIDLCTGVGNFEYLRKIIYFIYKIANFIFYGNDLFNLTITLNIISTMSRRYSFLKYDLVHLNWVALDYLTMKKISEIKLPIVWTIHDEQLIDGITHFPKQGKMLASSWLRKRHRYYMLKLIKQNNVTFIFPSLSLKLKFEGKYPTANTLHIPNPVSAPSKPIALSTQRYESNIIAVGGFSIFSDPRKGFDLLRSALQIKKLSTLYKVKVFGEEASDTALNDNYEVYGILNSDQVFNLISDAKFVVVPSRDENFPSIILEAMSIGIPVIATRVGGIPEIIEHGINGFLCDPNEDSISECLALATDISVKEYLNLSTAAKCKIADRYSYEMTRHSYIQAYLAQC